jgi:hypothetical protein
MTGSNYSTSILKIKLKSKIKKTRCATCNKTVEIVNHIPHEEYDDQIFSCGHGIELKKEPDEASGR